MVFPFGTEPGSAPDISCPSLRIALVTETYPPEINGVAVTVARLVAGLQRQGHHLQLIRPRQSEDASTPPAADLHQVLTRGLPLPRYPELKLGLPAHRQLSRLWRQSRPDVVHIATEGPLGWSALRTARRLRIPTVSEFRTNFHAYSHHYGVGLLHRPILGYLRSFHNRCHCTLVPTSALLQELTNAGFRNLRVVARGVDTRLFNPERRSLELRARWGASPDSVVVACVGRLAPEKNLSLLVRTYRHLQQLWPDTRLVLVGDGPARADLQRQIPEAVFAGKCRGDDLARHYASADLLLFPSLTETYGNVTPEAMASGLGVVAFDYGAARELIVHGHSGWRVPLADEDAFVKIAAEAAQDLSILRSTGQNALAVAATLGWDRIVAETVDAYRTPLPGPPRAAPALASSTQAGH